MTIHLPNDLESSIQAAVLSGYFSSVDEAMAKAARLLLHDLRTNAPDAHASDEALPDPILGCMRDDAALMDEIVADAYRQRQHETWQELDL